MKPLNLFLILILIINLSLNADAGIVEFPKGCNIAEKEDCSLMADGESAIIQTPEAEISLSSGAILTRNGGNELRLVSGLFLLRAKNSIQVDIKFGSVKIAVENLVILKITDEKAELIPVEGSLDYTLLNKEVNTLPVGYSVWVSYLNEKGIQRTGLPAPAIFSQVVANLAELGSFNKDQLSDLLHKYKPNWKSAINETSGRHVASVQLALVEEAKRKARLEQSRKAFRVERRKLKELFYRKTFLE